MCRKNTLYIIFYQREVIPIIYIVIFLKNNVVILEISMHLYKFLSEIRLH